MPESQIMGSGARPPGFSLPKVKTVQMLGPTNCLGKRTAIFTWAPR